MGITGADLQRRKKTKRKTNKRKNKRRTQLGGKGRMSRKAMRTKKPKKTKGKKKKGKKKLNAYMLALKKARKSNAESFVYKGKTYYQKFAKTGMAIYSSKK